MSNINDTYFDGYYKDIWKAIIPSELTVKEVDFMIQHFNLQPGMKVLDLMCGYGRHSIALAEKGISVTAVDNLAEYTDAIREIAETKKLPIETITTSIAGFMPNDTYDLVICMGNSLNFFDHNELSGILKMISSNLKSSGHFLINSWSIAEITFKSFQEKGWSQVGDYKFITDSKIVFHPTRIETEHLIIDGNDKKEIKKAVDYIYSISEFDQLFKAVGLVCKEIYSIPGRKKFSVGDPRIYIITALNK
jgi:cyclopropane fatty-acyl-phospholipid synthase-like methyltransferase